MCVCVCWRLEKHWNNAESVLFYIVGKSVRQRAIVFSRGLQAFFVLRRQLEKEDQESIQKTPAFQTFFTNACAFFG